jgi:uncharacterized Zn finger protein
MRPMIDFEAAGGVDPSRLERGVSLSAVEVQPGRYLVTGGREEHWVDLVSVANPRCDCGDHLWRDRVCKHILAALLCEGEPRVIHAVGELVRELRAVATPPRPRRRRSAAQGG